MEDGIVSGGDSRSRCMVRSLLVGERDDEEVVEGMGTVGGEDGVGANIRTRRRMSRHTMGPVELGVARSLGVVEVVASRDGDGARRVVVANEPPCLLILPTRRDLLAPRFHRLVSSHQLEPIHPTTALLRLLGSVSVSVNANANARSDDMK